MSNALMRGKTLKPSAVALAKQWREQRIQVLLEKHRLQLVPIECREIRMLTGRWDFWNYKIKEV